MNSLYTSGVRQTNSLQADLERLRNGDNSPALLGEFSLRYASVSLHNAFHYRSNIRLFSRYATDNRRL